MSPQGRYLRQLVPGGSRHVEFPDIFTHCYGLVTVNTAADIGSRLAMAGRIGRGGESGVPVCPLRGGAGRLVIESRMAELSGNLMVAQSGGPTAVINASVAGVVQEAAKHPCIGKVYGGLNGILGILNEQLIDLGQERPETVEGLKHTPAAALGTCRYKIDFKKK